jgi:hypothetical protein
MFQTKFGGNRNTHIIFKKFFSENFAVYEIIWNIVADRGKPHDNMEHAHLMLDT